VGDAEPVDPPSIPLPLEPLDVLVPGEQVVDLLDLDSPKPTELARVLRTGRVNGSRPDLRCDHRRLAPLLEGDAERELRAAVHRRGVEHSRAGVESRAHDLPCKLDVLAERVPGSEADDRAEPALLHHESD